MIERLYIDTRMLKHLALLRRSGKKAAQAAARAEEIIASLKACGWVPQSTGNLTKHGELRIRGVRKYDLGSGYRLITFKQARRLFLLYAGSHDSCDRWLENNRELPLDLIEQRCQCHPVTTTLETDQETERGTPAPRTERYDPLSAIDDGDLRRIFCGLTGEGP
jgi:hypothetical protein